MKRRVWPLRFGPFGLLSLGAFLLSGWTLLFLKFMIGMPHMNSPENGPKALFLGAGLLRAIRWAGLPLGNDAILFTTPLAFALLPIALWFTLNAASMLRGRQVDV